MCGCLLKSDKRLPSYTPKAILGPFVPSLQITSQSTCQTKFSKKKNKLSSVNHKILNKVRGCL